MPKKTLLFALLVLLGIVWWWRGASLPNGAVVIASPRANYFPNTVLRTHENREVRFYDDLIRGNKIVVLNFMYTHCDGI